MPPLETAPADGTGAANFTRRLRHVLVAVLTSSYRGIIASKRGLDCPFTANLGSRGVRSAGLLSGVDRTWTSMRAPMSNHGEGPTPGRHTNNMSVYRAEPEDSPQSNQWLCVWLKGPSSDWVSDGCATRSSALPRKWSPKIPSAGLSAFAVMQRLADMTGTRREAEALRAKPPKNARSPRSWCESRSGVSMQR
jgi:hypothetical protein